MTSIGYAPAPRRAPWRVKCVEGWSVYPAEPMALVLGTEQTSRRSLVTLMLNFSIVGCLDEAHPVDYDTVDELLASEQKDRDPTKEAALDAQPQRGTPTRKFLQVWAGETNNSQETLFERAKTVRVTRAGCGSQGRSSGKAYSWFRAQSDRVQSDRHACWEDKRETSKSPAPPTQAGQDWKSAGTVDLSSGSQNQDASSRVLFADLFEA
ncbi:hypothetical protein EV714DRAFT_232482 [Schizophyllum commune]